MANNAFIVAHDIECYQSELENVSREVKKTFTKKRTASSTYLMAWQG